MLKEFKLRKDKVIVLMRLKKSVGNVALGSIIATI